MTLVETVLDTSFARTQRTEMVRLSKEIDEHTLYNVTRDWWVTGGLDANRIEPTSTERLAFDVMPKFRTMNLNEQAHILDLGSGMGNCLAFLSKLGYKAYGVEQNQELCKQSIQRMQSIAPQLQFPLPQICHADYNDQAFWNRPFADGRLPSEMDAFYYYNYGPEHALELVELFVRHSNPGTILMLGGLGPRISNFREYNDYLESKYEGCTLTVGITTAIYRTRPHTYRVDFIRKDTLQFEPN